MLGQEFQSLHSGHRGDEKPIIIKWIKKQTAKGPVPTVLRANYKKDFFS